MLQPEKKGPDLEQCHRYQKFTSNYWVVSSWVTLKFLAHKSIRKYAWESVFNFVPKCWRKGQRYNLQRNDPIYNVVKGLEGSHLTTGWPHVEWHYSFLPTKVKKNMPESRFLFWSQNVEKWANVIAYEERTQFRSVSNVSKIHIYLLDDLVLSDIKDSCPWKPKKICPRVGF